MTGLQISQYCVGQIIKKGSNSSIYHVKDTKAKKSDPALILKMSHKQDEIKREIQTIGRLNINRQVNHSGIPPLIHKGKL
jgi:hypothetical protein